MENIYPPSFEGHPLAQAFVVFGLLTCGLLSAEWLWRLLWSLVERPLPLRHPASVVRLINITLLVSILMRVTPDISLVMLAQESDKSVLNYLEWIDRIMDGASAIPLVFAWFWSLIGFPMIAFQLSREPLPVNLWPHLSQCWRPIKIGGLVLLISLAVTFLR